MIRHGWGIAVLAACGVAQPVAAQRLAAPPGWAWALDAPARLTDRPFDPATAPDTLWRFVSMPVGWQVTTGPGVLLYPADQPADSGYVVESELAILPTSGVGEVGLFVAGAEGSDSTYVAFVTRVDGSFAVVRRSDTATTYLVPWSRHAAVPARAQDHGLVRQLMRLRVTRTAVTFAVNGIEIATLPRGSLSASGRVGLRLGQDLDVRISTLNLTYQLAPFRR